MQPAEGTVIAGKYRLERHLAKGGMGAVWTAHHLGLDTRIAVKLIDPAMAQDPASRARFEREARAAAAIKSPHIVQMIDHGVDQGTPYIAMELLQGEDLGARLQREGRLSLEEAARLFAQLGRALGKAHEARILHRDLKPANLFLTKIDDDELLKVLDFGIAKRMGAVAGEATKTGQVFGTPHYMSPEQVSGDKGIDHRSDLWAAGVIAYRMVTGTLPFQGASVEAILSNVLFHPPRAVRVTAPDLPAELDLFFSRAPNGLIPASYAASWNWMRSRFSTELWRRKSIRFLRTPL
jgi:serine/threonine-protein kinase